MCYITTSRKAGPITRRLARALSNLFGCYYNNRGKKSFNSVLRDAEDRGMRKVVFVHEYHANPRIIKAVRINGNEWSEIGEVRFNCVKVERMTRRAKPNDVAVNAMHRDFIRIFNLRKKGIYVRSHATFSRNLIIVLLNGVEKVVLKLV